MSCAAGLHVEGDRVARYGMCAFEIAKLYKLVADKVRVAVCNDQMSFTFSYRQVRHQPRCASSGSVNDVRRRKFCAITQDHTAPFRSSYGLPQIKHGPCKLCAFDQIHSSTGRIQHGIKGHKQCAWKGTTQIRLGLSQGLGVEDLR